jgi:hypothetical protein
MSFVAITDAELNLGIEYAQQRFRQTVSRDNLFKIAEYLLTLRQTEHLSIGEAFTPTFDFFNLEGERREMYKAILGKMFSSRAKRMHKGRTSLRQRSHRREYTIDQNGQYGFVLPR